MITLQDKDDCSTVTWALKAYKWASKPYPADPSRTTFSAWLSRVEAEVRVTKKCTLMRNQASMGMSNNYWPCLSRLAIMAYPYLAIYIHPNHREPLDGAAGTALLNKQFRDLTGENPKVSHWNVARDRLLYAQSLKS